MQAAPQPERPAPSEFGQEVGNVLPFPQRRAGTPLLAEPHDDLARYEQAAPLDDRTRTLMNMIAVVIVTLLIAAGVWIADIIADTDRDQDCILQGRSNCLPIKQPLTSRQ